MNVALIIAGGAGKRMAQDIPKQFLSVYDKPIILYTMEAFQNHPEVDKIEVVCIDGWQETLKSYAKQFNISKLDKIITGGESRYESTLLGFKNLTVLDDEDIIVIHDSIRALVTQEMITDSIRVCREYGASMSAVPCTDSMYSTRDNVVTDKNMQREFLMRGQTPEGITYGRAKLMYNEARNRNIQNDAITALQIELGMKVYFSRGSEKNIKITTAEDLYLFKALLKVEKSVWIK